MSPMAVDLFTGALRPLHSRAWDVQVDTDGLERLRELNRTLPAGLPAQPPLLRRPAGAGRRARRARLPAQPRARRGQPAVLAGRAAGQAGRDRVHPAQLRRRRDLQAGRPRVLRLPARQAVQPRVVHGGRPVADRQAAPAAATGCCATSPRRSSAAGSTTSTSSRSRSPTTSCARSPRWPPSSAAPRRRARGCAGWRRYARGAAARRSAPCTSRFAEPISLRAALDGRARTRPTRTRAGWPCRRWRSRWPWGSTGSPRSMATALVTLALLGVRDRALTLGQVRRVLEPVLGLRRPSAALPHSGDALRTPAGVRAGARARWPRQKVVTIYTGGEEPVLRDRARPAPGRGVLPQQRDPPLRRPGDRRAGPAARPGRPLGGGERLRDLLKFEFFFPERDTYRAAARRRAASGSTRTGRPPTAATCWPGAGFLIAHRVLRSFLDAQLVVAERLAARDPRGPGRGEGVPDRVRRGRPADAAAGQAARPGVAVAGAVHQRAEAGRATSTWSTPGREELARRRQAFAAQLRDVVGRVVRIDEIDAAARREAVGVSREHSSRANRATLRPVRSSGPRSS